MRKPKERAETERGKAMSEKNKIGYFVKDNGETIEDADYFTSQEFQIYTEEEITNLAKKAMSRIWLNRWGWEWMNPGCVITMVVDGKEAGNFVLDSIESEPIFIVKKEKANDIG